MEEKGRRVIFTQVPIAPSWAAKKKNVTSESLSLGHNPHGISHTSHNNSASAKFKVQELSPHHQPTDQQGRKETTQRQLTVKSTSKNEHSKKWVAFTLTERVSPRALSLTPALAQPGSRPPPSKSRSRSASWPRRVLLPPRLVSSSGTRMGLRRLRLLLVCLFQHSKDEGIDEEIIGWVLMAVFDTGNKILRILKAHGMFLI